MTDCWKDYKDYAACRAEVDRLKGIRKQLTKQAARQKAKIHELLLCQYQHEQAELKRLVYDLWQAEKEVDALLDWLGCEQPPLVMGDIGERHGH